MNNGFDPERRRLLATSLPAVGMLAAAAPPTSPIALGVSPPLSGNRRIAHIADFGAKGDGQNDDSPAFTAALAVADVVSVPPGRYKITRPIILRDGQSLLGAGKSGWEPYTGVGPPASAVKTEIAISSGTAIDARNTNNASVHGISLRSNLAQQSKWAYNPGYQPGTIGIDISGALQFSANEISFHGLHRGVLANASDKKTAQMPVIENWNAHDCDTVFYFASSTNVTPARDARIANCSSALHCGRIVEVRDCDGIRIENVRFFQCVLNSVLVENTPFVSIIGATMFETGDETIIFRKSNAIVMSGVQIVRAGLYHAPPLVQKTAVLLESCHDFSFSGLIERPLGRAFSIKGCKNISISGTVSTPFWSTGSLGSNDAAIFIEDSHGISINCAFGGSDYWIAVGSDTNSARSITGKIALDGIAGVLRCVQLQESPLGYVARLPLRLAIPANEMKPVDSLRLLIPPNGTLVTRSVELTIEGTLVQLGNHRLSMRGGEAGGGSLSTDRKLLYRNDTGAARYVSIDIGIYNPTEHPVTIPAGVEIRASLAVE